VEVARVHVFDTERRVQPAEEDVARGLHQPLALDNPHPLVADVRPAITQTA
jgi:hypothetical protein